VPFLFEDLLHKELGNGRKKARQQPPRRRLKGSEHRYGFEHGRLSKPGANPTIASYNASVVKIYSAVTSMARF
jgi:hypothetical protein